MEKILVFILCVLIVKEKVLCSLPEIRITGPCGPPEIKITGPSEPPEIRITGPCGPPGVDHSSAYSPKKPFYNDGDSVTYKCPRDTHYNKYIVRTCKAGKWIGDYPNCGSKVVNQVMNIKVVDIVENTTLVDVDTGELNNYRFHASFYERASWRLYQTRVYNKNKWLQWHLRFNSSKLFDIFNIHFYPINNTGLDGVKLIINSVFLKHSHQSFKYAFNFDHSALVQNFKEFWFLRQSSSQSNSSNLVNDDKYSKPLKSQTGELELTFQSYTDYPELVALIEVYLSKFTRCKIPDAQFLTTLYLDPMTEDEILQCDSSLAIKVEDVAENETSNILNGCKDSKSPKCLPLNYCRVNETGDNLQMKSIEKALILNSSSWFAVEGTQITYRCKSGFLLGDSSIICQSNFKWNRNQPICRQFDTKGNGYLYGIIIGLVFVVILIMILIFIIIKYRNRRRPIQDIIDLNRLKAETSYYDDITEARGSGDHNVYYEIPHYDALEIDYEPYGDYKGSRLSQTNMTDYYNTSKSDNNYSSGGRKIEMYGVDGYTDMH